MANVNEHLPSALPARSPSPTSDERGFTLVESLVAMVILTIGLVALAELLAISLRMQQLGRNETQAVRVATDKLDELNSLYFGDVGTGLNEDARIAIGGSLTGDVGVYFDTPVDANGVALPYVRRWLVEAGPDGNPDLRQITIRVIPTLADARTTATFEMISIIRRI